MRRRRLVSILLALSLCLALLPTAALAEGETEAPVSTAEDANGTVKLTDDITITEGLKSERDVTGDTWCAEAIRWAVSEGVALGFDDGSFGWDRCVTREQLAAKGTATRAQLCTILQRFLAK